MQFLHAFLLANVALMTHHVPTRRNRRVLKAGLSGQLDRQLSKMSSAYDASSYDAKLPEIESYGCADDVSNLHATRGLMNHTGAAET